VDTADLSVKMERMPGHTTEQGLEIPPRLRHRIRNESDTDLEFILCSQPSTAGDRINIKEEL
jgi:mannose-6-phosphate isomerase-like protein (cupin superfamily)